MYWYLACPINYYNIPYLGWVVKNFTELPPRFFLEEILLALDWELQKLSFLQRCNWLLLKQPLRW